MDEEVGTLPSSVPYAFVLTRLVGESAFVGKDEPATMPRVSQLIIVSRLSPWCTIIKKETGVTIGDLCSAIFKECVIPPFLLSFLPSFFLSLTFGQLYGE